MRLSALSRALYAGRMAHRVGRHLRLKIDEYDVSIRRFIPGYQTMLDVAADAVAGGSPALVVDLGAGTGALSEALLEHKEVGAVQALDIDPDMMALARSRLARFGDRARFALRSYDGAFAPCDAFAASLALHHIPTLEAKTALFARAFAALPAGGLLVNADANMPQDSAKRERLYREWADHMVRGGIPEQRAWQHFGEWAEEDTYLPLDAELEALARVGFRPQCVWRNGPNAVVVAAKP